MKSGRVAYMHDRKNEYSKVGEIFLEKKQFDGVKEKKHSLVKLNKYTKIDRFKTGKNI